MWTAISCAFAGHSSLLSRRFSRRASRPRSCPRDQAIAHVAASCPQEPPRLPPACPPGDPVRRDPPTAIVPCGSDFNPQSPRIYLIHVGKAGGTTLTRTLLLDNTTVNGVNVAARAVRCILGSENKVDPDGNIVMKIGTDWKNASSFCYNHPPGASELARRTLGVFHMQGSPYSIDDNAWLMNNTNLFLFTVRDPIERLVSAYNYHWNIYKRYYSQVGGSPQLEKFYSQCFNRGIDSMVNDMRNGTSLDCLMMGVKWLLGKIIDGEEHSEFNYEYYWKYALGERPTITDGAEHFEFNYEYYWRYALGQRPNRPVAVLRTEHLWEDVIHMDQAIGGTGYFGNVEGFKFSHGSENYTKSQGTDFGASNTVFLCCLISREIEYYQRLILKAVNLSDKQKRESLHDLLNRCHIKEYSSWLSGVQEASIFLATISPGENVQRVRFPLYIIDAMARGEFFKILILNNPGG